MNNLKMSSQGCFVTGTDTGVGKTVVTAALASYLRSCQVSVGVMKPVETGVDEDDPQLSDAGILQKMAEVSDSLALICPYAFPDPLAPLSAARRQGRIISLDKIRRAYHQLCVRYEYMLVEGAGGTLVPIGQNLLILDIMVMCRLPIVVVGRTSLGGINHLLLTVERIQREGLPLLAVVLNQTEPQSLSSVREQQTKSTIDLIREFTEIPVLGPLLPVSENLADPTALASMAKSQVIRELGELVMLKEIQRP